jgi:hypothetical protein
MPAISCFSKDYAEARRKFRAAAVKAGAVLRSYPHPLKGPRGEELATDVARIGPAGAKRVLMIQSATHGVEGFCGSGAQIAWLKSGDWKRLPKGIAVVLVHAINPYGFAWIRRVTQENVDLNRNFPDFSALPKRSAYSEIQPHIFPERWDEASNNARRTAFREFVAKHGAMALQEAISGGQYAHADGIFFGGREPTWSHRTFAEIVARYCSKARSVAFVDLHTGLGPYGHGELISMGRPGVGQYDRNCAWYGPAVTSPEAGSSTSAKLVGLMEQALARMLPKTEVTSIAIEYGTYPTEEVLESLMADNWLHLRGELDSPLGRAIKARIRRAFYPDEDDWKELVALKARLVLRRAAAGLAAS